MSSLSSLPGLSVLWSFNAAPAHINSVLVCKDIADDGRIVEAAVDPDIDGEGNYSTNIVLIKKYMLETLVTNAHSRNEVSFQKNVLMNCIKTGKVYAFDATDSLSAQLTVFKAILTYQ